MSFESLNAIQSKSCSKEFDVKNQEAALKNVTVISMYMNIMYNNNYSVRRSWWVIHLKNAYHSKSGSQVAWYKKKIICSFLELLGMDGQTEKQSLTDRHQQHPPFREGK